MVWVWELGEGGKRRKEKRGLEGGRGRLGRWYCRGEVVVDCDKN